MRFWIVGGGTGGHVYPALAVAQALQAAAPEAGVPRNALTWIGSIGGMEAELIARAGLPFIGIPAGGLHGVALLNAVRNGWQLTRGTFAALRHLRRERPDAILTTGGYVSGPVAVAAAWRQVPILVYLPDIEPAQSVKALARLATRIGVTVEDSRDFLPAKKVIVTGYPLGERITRWNRVAGRQALGLPLDDLVLLVFGGSRGARSINRALLAQLPALTEVVHVLHVSGELDWPEISAARETLPEDVKARYHAYAYLHDEMGAAMAAADLAVCRAGASILGEFPYFGLPSILVPYPHAWRYQKVNAAWLADRGAAVVVEDAELPTQLASTACALLQDTARREAMATAARTLARPDAAQRLAELLVQVTGGAKARGMK
ncbi:MAG: undecaprenyldiphospho-muramoylpentapeptide beta-N-acetylglucosaminyltransferase [Anaerolineae bacterium]|nr:undecaprenyldiphospho-muramoylpentapeptide beta-N-acetylglucosaminyltransferase [Anaerolineae bacterium]